MTAAGAAAAEIEELKLQLQAAREEAAHAHAQAAARQAELVAAAKLATLGSLIAGIAHELNSPLGALNSNHDVLKRALGRLQNILEDEVVEEHELDELRRVVRAVHNVLEVNNLAVDRLVQLVTSLRTFGRPDRADRDCVDLRESIESSLALLDHELRTRITVAREYQDDLPAVECFPNQLNQVFMNLLVNATQAIPGEGRIAVRVHATSADVVIEVEDSGVGIEPQNLDHIFEPGFTTKGGRIGMGLGLLIVRQIVDRHRGSIRVSSTPGSGSTFTVTLPLAMRPPSTSALNP